MLILYIFSTSADGQRLHCNRPTIATDRSIFTNDQHCIPIPVLSQIASVA